MEKTKRVKIAANSYKPRAPTSRHRAPTCPIPRRVPPSSRDPRRERAAALARASSAARADTGRATAPRPERSGCRNSRGSLGPRKPTREEILGTPRLEGMGLARDRARPSRWLPPKRATRSRSSRCVRRRSGMRAMHASSFKHRSTLRLPAFFFREGQSDFQKKKTPFAGSSPEVALPIDLC